MTHKGLYLHFKTVIYNVQTYYLFILDECWSTHGFVVSKFNKCAAGPIDHSQGHQKKNG
jgi:hypothetical protein